MYFTTDVTKLLHALFLFCAHTFNFLKQLGLFIYPGLWLVKIHKLIKALINFSSSFQKGDQNKG